MTGTLPSIDRARAYVAKVPGAVAGQGGHDQTFSVACSLVNGFALNPIGNPPALPERLPKF
jgi:hypothetical protein